LNAAKNLYAQLVKTAQSQYDKRLTLFIKAICGVDNRMIERRFITPEVLWKGYAQIASKGKNHTLILKKELCRLFWQRCRRKGISVGWS